MKMYSIKWILKVWRENDTQNKDNNYKQNNFLWNKLSSLHQLRPKCIYITYFWKHGSREHFYLTQYSIISFFWGKHQYPIVKQNQYLETMGWALRIRWLWQQRTDPSKPWVGLPIQIPRIAQALFDVAIESLVGNGEGTKFWADRWLQGKSIQDFAPDLIKLVPKRISKKRTVKVTLNNRRWVFDIKGALTVQVILEYLTIWGLVDDMVFGSCYFWSALLAPL